MRPLIICRVPIRKEAMDVFTEMGIEHFGILLSEKRFHCLSQRAGAGIALLTDPDRVHRVPDYSGANKEEREARIRQIINIARDNNYNSIFAGYGFMAEDEMMVAAMEARAQFYRPLFPHRARCRPEGRSQAHRPQDRRIGHPGIDNGTALTLLKTPGRRRPQGAGGRAPAGRGREETLDDNAITLEDKADIVLAASYDKGIDLYTVAETSDTLTEAVRRKWRPTTRKPGAPEAISGGGGKASASSG